MAASVAWTQRGKEGSGSQKQHLIKGGREREGEIGSRRVRPGNLEKKIDTIPFHGVYL